MYNIRLILQWFLLTVPGKQWCLFSYVDILHLSCIFIQGVDFLFWILRDILVNVVDDCVFRLFPLCVSLWTAEMIVLLFCLGLLLLNQCV